MAYSFDLVGSMENSTQIGHNLAPVPAHGFSTWCNQYTRIALQTLGVQISSQERVSEWAHEGRDLIREVHTHCHSCALAESRAEPRDATRAAQRRRAADGPASRMALTIKTNLGPLKVELFCAQTPKTCKNFLALAASGYYDNTNFHRNIKGFMIQGGDPTGTGKGGQSIYGGYFEDEFVSTLKHERRGCLSMVNTGPNTNGSQFFITYSRQPHLNGVYTTFGRLIDGLDTLDKMEKEPINAKNRPMRPIKIESIIIHANPIADEEAQQ
ncbi:unnamed protein product [Durusdinium trenchii]|uniref:Peptidyl-prolyl cis-trans isomerase n=1 Tax=Durusdinium trenchii TaxID=1381693 RepID=A0ABP0QE52_9DINO